MPKDSAPIVLAMLILTVGSGLAEDVPKRVTEHEALAAAATKVAPDYPPIAKQLKIEGQVELQVLIGESGSVEEVKIMSGNPMLTKPAAEALKKWKFKPFVSDGKPGKVWAPVGVNFKI